MLVIITFFLIYKKGHFEHELPAFSSSSNLSALTFDARDTAANPFLLQARMTGLTWESLRGQSAA